MKLYIVHCGFYDSSDSSAIFENHANFYLVAENFEDAKERMKAHPSFKQKKMHIDGLQEIHTVDGYAITPKLDSKLEGVTRIANMKYGSREPQMTESFPS